jgi:hypothetical protein
MKFLSFDVVICVVLDVSHHLFIKNNIKILISIVMKNWSFSAFSLAESPFHIFDFSEDKRKNGEIFMFRNIVLCVSGFELSLVLHK